MIKTLTVLLLLTAGITFGVPAPAQTTPATTKQASQKAPVKKKAPTAVHEDDQVPDVSASSAVGYNCELGNKLTIYRNAEDDRHIALRWKNKLLRLKRVATTTGANRFENIRNGLVWIDIPAKGMLLDSKKGRQLAQDCVNRS